MVGPNAGYFEKINSCMLVKPNIKNPRSFKYFTPRFTLNSLIGFSLFVMLTKCSGDKSELASANVCVDITKSLETEVKAVVQTACGECLEVGSASTFNN